MALLRQAAKAISSSAAGRRLSTFALPPLKYEYDALEPYIDAKTMQIHHTRHHQTYVSSLNSIIGGEHGSAIKGMPLAEVSKVCATLPEAIRTGATNHAGGHYNHTLFFSLLRGDAAGGLKQPGGELRTALEEGFGSIEAFKSEFDTAAIKHFGSGWAWLSVDAKGGLFVSSTANQENPLMEGVVTRSGTPVLGLDVWEHAYYLQNQNRRPEYVASFWNVVDWEQVSANYAAARDGKTAPLEVPMEE